MRLSGYLLLSLYLLSCHSKNQDSKLIETTSIHKSFILEKLDSIQIDFLGNPTVHDIDPQSRTVLFMEHKESSEDIFVADFRGNILSSFSKFGDKPDTYGALMGTVRILESNAFLVYGYKGFLTYDFDGKLQSLVKYDNFQVPSQSMRAMGYGMEKLGDQYLYINQQAPPQEVNEYKDFKLLSSVDPKTGRRDPIIQFPEKSLYLNGNYFFWPSWFPVFTIDGDSIYVVFGSEPVIYVFDAKEPYSLKSSIPLNFSDYNYFKGTDNPSDIEFIGMPFISGMIKNIKKINGFFAVAYFPGYDALDSETNFENKSPEETTIFLERMGKKYPNRIAIIDSLGNVISDFVPDGLVAESMLIRNGELWMMEKPDEEEERDYFRLFKVGLKIEK